MGRGGYPERLRIGGSCKTAKKAPPGSIAAHPFGKLRACSCKKRKDGHPHSKGGPHAEQFELATYLRQ